MVTHKTIENQVNVAMCIIINIEQYIQIELCVEVENLYACINPREINSKSFVWCLTKLKKI